MEEKIRKAILAIVDQRISNRAPLSCEYGKVKQVSGDTCTVTIDELDIDGVLLGFDKSGVIVYPEVDSDVLVLFTDTKKTAGVVVYVEKTASIKMMGDVNGGIGLTQKIAERLERVETAFENLQNTFNSHLITYNTHVHTGGTIMGSTGTAAPDTNVSAENVNPKTNQNYISSTKIKHGNG